MKKSKVEAGSIKSSTPRISPTRSGARFYSARSTRRPRDDGKSSSQDAHSKRQRHNDDPGKRLEALGCVLTASKPKVGTPS